MLTAGCACLTSACGGPDPEAAHSGERVVLVAAAEHAPAPAEPKAEASVGVDCKDGTDGPAAAASAAVADTKLAAPRFTAEPEAASVGAGELASFEVVAEGSLPLQFQWFRNGEPIPGATFARYFTPPAQAGDDGAEYSVAVRNAAGVLMSDAATLSVTGLALELQVEEDPDPAADLHPAAEPDSAGPIHDGPA